MLLSGIVEIVNEVYDSASSGDQEEVLCRRLDPLLDTFLMESQPIVGADVTILLADIRGFTALTRLLPPKLLVDLLNRFFSAMCEVVKRHDGVVDKFMGDSVMALFGAPRGRPDDLQRALSCAVDMQHAVVKLNQVSRGLGRGEPSLYAGIAVNTGRVMAGSFGSALHSEYTVIGDTVNLASRIESFSLRGQVLLSEASYSAARHLIEVGRVNQVRVKGMAQPVSLYELRSVNAPHRLVIPDVETRKSPRISVNLDAIFRQIESKQIDSDHFVGHINDMGYYGMRADLPVGLAPCSEVVVTLGPDMGADAADEVYARVLRAEPRGLSFRTSLAFTAIDTPGHRQVKQYVDDQLWRR